MNSEIAKILLAIGRSENYRQALVNKIIAGEYTVDEWEAFLRVAREDLEGDRVTTALGAAVTLLERLDTLARTKPRTSLPGALKVTRRDIAREHHDFGTIVVWVGLMLSEHHKMTLSAAFHEIAKRTGRDYTTIRNLYYARCDDVPPIYGEVAMTRAEVFALLNRFGEMY